MLPIRQMGKPGSTGSCPPAHLAAVPAAQGEARTCSLRPGEAPALSSTVVLRVPSPRSALPLYLSHTPIQGHGRSGGAAGSTGGCRRSRPVSRRAWRRRCLGCSGGWLSYCYRSGSSSACARQHSFVTANPSLLLQLAGRDEWVRVTARAVAPYDGSLHAAAVADESPLVGACPGLGAGAGCAPGSVAGQPASPCSWDNFWPLPGALTSLPPRP